MSQGLPNPNTWGIVENPLVFSPFMDGEGGGGGAMPSNAFLLLDGTLFKLLDGTNFLLLGT